MYNGGILLVAIDSMAKGRNKQRREVKKPKKVKAK